MSKIVLFEDKADCCGCGACMNKCPKGAITMQQDEYGFVYPVIDDEKCIECGLCKTVCGYQSIPAKHEPIGVYAAAHKNEKSLKKSASGGAFAAFAEKVLASGGVVYGSAFIKENDKLCPKHIRVDNMAELIKLQGSKYVQSDIADTYKEAEKDLKEGKRVLFSGTPCQIAGLRAFLKKDYENLLTIDIICHGVPSAQFFHDFISVYEKKLGGKITEFYFRDKSKGQGMISRTVLADNDGKQCESVKPGKSLSYILFFSKSYTYRTNCYSCRFAAKERVSDITIGDFWGFHEEYPQIDPTTSFSNTKGISCILINTKAGADMIECCSDSFLLMESEFEKIAKHNDQLHTPSKYNPLREKILALYSNEGYASVEKFFRKNFKKDILKEWISFLIPKSFKQRLKITLSKLKRG